MTETAPVRLFQVERARVEVHQRKVEAGRAAAAQAARVLRSTLESKGSARIVVATGNSQEDLIEALRKIPGIDWGHIDAFHMDEYVGLPANHPASFRRWVRERLADIVHPRSIHYLNGEASDLEKECQRYADLLCSAPLDICFVGFGENGHVAFNDPHVADFNDPLMVKRVVLDDRCRMQQVGEGHFTSLDAVPREALTLTIPALIRAKCVVSCVPEARKAEAVRNAFEGPLSPFCPASVVRTHPSAFVYLDVDSASLL